MIAWARMVAALGVTVAVDQVTKAIVVANVERGEQINVFLGIDITNVRNTGIAFGAFAGAATPIAIAGALALCGLVAYFALHTHEPLLWLPVGAVLGGAAANLADRAREGAVIDFIDPVAWPAFNVADIAIVAGVLGLLYLSERPRRRRHD